MTNNVFNCINLDVTHFTKRAVFRIAILFEPVVNCRVRQIRLHNHWIVYKNGKNNYFTNWNINEFGIWCMALLIKYFTFIYLCRNEYFTFNFVLFNCSVARNVLIFNITEKKRSEQIYVLSTRHTTHDTRHP